MSKNLTRVLVAIVSLVVLTGGGAACTDISGQRCHKPNERTTTTAGSYKCLDPDGDGKYYWKRDK